MTAPMQDEELDDVIDMEQYSTKKDEEDLEGVIDMEEYSKSKEAEEATWWDSAKEAGIQAGLGFAQAYTYPLDILKIGMLAEGLSDIDEVEEAFKKAGKTFDKDKYIKTIMEQGEFVPTQELLEKQFTKYTGVDLEPKTRTGKFFNKLFFLTGLAKGKGFTKEGLTKGAIGGVAGATTTAALREAGAPEIVSELGGDVVGGGISAIEKQVRKLSPEAARIQQIADKHGLPLMEFMLQDEIPTSAKITQGRKAAFEKELGMTTEEAINKIVEGKIPVSKLRGQGQDLEVLETEAYDKAKGLARANPNPLSTDQLVADIDAEIARIRGRAPVQSDGEEAAIRILEKQRDAISKSKSNTEQLVNLTQNNNSNVKSIYKKAEFSGVEEDVKNAYGFVNNAIRNNIEREAGKEVSDAYKVANSIYAQNASLARVEGLISKSFQNGEFSAKKLNQLLNSKQGAFLRRDLGEQGVKELRDIAEFGEKAQKATNQFANSSKHSSEVSQWGPLAGFLIAKVPPVAGAAAVLKPLYNYYRGWALTNPAARTVYRDILKNAANGSFKNMAKDFATLEDLVIKEFGSLEEFTKQGINEIKFYEEGEED